MTISVVVEGATDLPVVEKILSSLGCSVKAAYGLNGKHSVMRNLQGYNNAAQFEPWLALRDLDGDAPCAGELVRSTLPRPAEWMRYRVAVREVEAWLIADPQALSRFLRVRRALVPGSPESLEDPKRSLVNLARRSASASIRRDMVPEPGLSVEVGPGYSSRVREFVEQYWRPEIAALNATSLQRCIARVQELLAFRQV